MAKIFYSMSGEGRGHAARSAALVDQLRKQYELTLFAPEQAYDFLVNRFDRRSGVRVYPIRGLRFRYSGTKLSLFKTIASGVRFWSQLSPSIDEIAESIRRQQPDLIISDFEPILPRAATRCGFPFVSLDHQHFLTTFDLSSLPIELRIWASIMRLAVHAHYQRPSATIVTSFFQPPRRSGLCATTCVGPIVRSSVYEARPTSNDHLVSYLRQQTPESVLHVLKTAPCEVRVYGLGGRAPDGNLRFQPFDPDRFVDDLASCRAVVGAAGHQTLCESLYLRKPVLALPEQRHFEQRINAFYLARMNFGSTELLDRLQPSHLTDFLGRLDRFAPAIDSLPRDGNAATLDALSRMMSGSLSFGLVA